MIGKRPATIDDLDRAIRNLRMEIDGRVMAVGGAVGEHDLLSTYHADTLAADAVRGDLIYAEGDNTWTRLPIGAAGEYVRSDGTDITWSELLSADINWGAVTGLAYLAAGVLSQKTLGIANTNIPPIDMAGVADNDYAKFTASGLEGRSYSEVLGDLSGQAGAAFSWNSQNLTNVGTIGAGIATVTGLTISSPAAYNPVQISSAAYNSIFQIQIDNSNAGASAISRFVALAGGAGGSSFEMCGAGYTGTGARLARAGVLIGSGTGGLNFGAENASGLIRFYTGGIALANLRATIDAAGVLSTMSIYPIADDTYYLGKNDDDSPFAWKGVILKDTTDGKYYRVEVVNGVVTATDLTD